MSAARRRTRITWSLCNSISSALLSIHICVSTRVPLNRKGSFSTPSPSLRLSILTEYRASNVSGPALRNLATTSCCVALLEILHDDANMGTWCSRSRSLDFVILNYAGLMVSFRFVLVREIEAIGLMIEQHLFVLVMKIILLHYG